MSVSFEVSWRPIDLAPDGTTVLHVIVLGVTVSISHEAGPKLTTVSVEKPFPRMVTKVPPYMLPVAGEKLSITKVLVM